MKAYVTSIGEKTTRICCEQLEKYGFEVVLLSDKEKWIEKYRRFIKMADEDCLRIDADIIVNENVKKISVAEERPFMTQYIAYCLYKNNLKVGVGLLYTKEGLDIIRRDFDSLDFRRPEASAWRLPNVNERTKTEDLVIGMHGFFQDKDVVESAKQNKTDRGQLKDYDFELVDKLLKL